MMLKFGTLDLNDFLFLMDVTESWKLFPTLKTLIGFYDDSYTFYILNNLDYGILAVAVSSWNCLEYIEENSEHPGYKNELMKFLNKSV